MLDHVYMKTEKTPNEIIDALGGTTATAKIFDITPEAVSAWRKRGIPKSHERYLKVVKPELFKKEKS